MTITQIAGQARKDACFRELKVKVDTAPTRARLKTAFGGPLKGVEYLGRLFAAHATFIEFCRSPKQRDFSFKYEVLTSQSDKWDGDRYMAKITSRTGNLGLADLIDEEKPDRGGIGSEIERIGKSEDTVARSIVRCSFCITFPSQASRSAWTISVAARNHAGYTGRSCSIRIRQNSAA